jgi:hypothetical protein
VIVLAVRWYLGFSSVRASRGIEARDRLGGFSSPEEVRAFAEVPDATVDVLPDRLIFLALPPDRRPGVSGPTRPR